MHALLFLSFLWLSGSMSVQRFFFLLAKRIKKKKSDTKYLGKFCISCYRPVHT